jgi:hypothetical protein
MQSRNVLHVGCVLWRIMCERNAGIDLLRMEPHAPDMAARFCRCLHHGHSQCYVTLVHHGDHAPLGRSKFIGQCGHCSGITTALSCLHCIHVTAHGHSYPCPVVAMVYRTRTDAADIPQSASMLDGADGARSWQPWQSQCGSACHARAYVHCALSCMLWQACSHAQSAPERRVCARATCISASSCVELLHAGQYLHTVECRRHILTYLAGTSGCDGCCAAVVWGLKLSFVQLIGLV